MWQSNIFYQMTKWSIINDRLLILKKYAKSFFWWKRINFLKPACFSQTTAHDYICDEYFEKNDVKWERGIKGLTSGVFMDNFYSQYYDQVSIISIKTNWDKTRSVLWNSIKTNWDHTCQCDKWRLRSNHSENSSSGSKYHKQKETKEWRQSINSVCLRDLDVYCIAHSL